MIIIMIIIMVIIPVTPCHDNWEHKSWELCPTRHPCSQGSTNPQFSGLFIKDDGQGNDDGDGKDADDDDDYGDDDADDDERDDGDDADDERLKGENL